MQVANLFNSYPLYELSPQLISNQAHFISFRLDLKTTSKTKEKKDWKTDQTMLKQGKIIMTHK